MGKIGLAARIVLATGFLTTAVVAHAPLPDLDSCHDELGGLLRTASDVSDAAENAHSKLTDFADCKRNPELHDLVGDGCSGRRSDFQSAKWTIWMAVYIACKILTSTNSPEQDVIFGSCTASPLHFPQEIRSPRSDAGERTRDVYEVVGCRLVQGDPGLSLDPCDAICYFDCGSKSVTVEAIVGTT